MTHRSWLKLLLYSGIRNMWRGEEQSQGSREDDENSSALRSKGVFNGHFHFVKSDISSTGGRRITGLDRLGLNTFTSRDQDDGETVVGLATCGEAAGEHQYLCEVEKGSAALHSLVGVHSTGNPFLCPVNDPVLSVFGLPGVGLETKHVRSSVSFRDGEANEFLPRKHIGEHFLLEFLGTEVHYGRKTDYQTTHDTCIIMFSLEKMKISGNPDRHRNHGRRNGRLLEM